MAQYLLRRSRVANLFTSESVDAHAPDTVANDLVELRPVRIAPIRRTLGEIRSHYLQSAFEIG